MMEREYEIPPCRVIFTDGRFTEAAQAHHKAIPLVRPMEPEPPTKESIQFFEKRGGLRTERPPKPVTVAPEPPERIKEPPPKPKRKIAFKPRRPGVTIEAIRALQQQGLGAEAIAVQIGCHADTVYSRIREANGGPTRPKHKLSQQDQATIVRLRNSGTPPIALAKRYDISRNRVYELCKMHAKILAANC